MERTAVFRRQHEEILEIAGELTAVMAEPERLAEDAEVVRGLLTVLSGKISIHLAMEDKGLYPRLLKHAKPEVRTLAGTYMAEMGGIKDVFAEYLGRWPDGARIQGDPRTFIEETRGLLAALERRISREDNELYPMVDGIG